MNHDETEMCKYIQLNSEAKDEPVERNMLPGIAEQPAEIDSWVATASKYTKQPSLDCMPPTMTNMNHQGIKTPHGASDLRHVCHNHCRPQFCKIFRGIIIIII
jgi:hypothetical protein